MRLLWVRHGQMAERASDSRDLHAINRFFSQRSGHGLSERGKRQAVRVSEHFACHPVDALYCSPLTRAQETAQVTASSLGLRCHVRDELRELQTGHLRKQSPEAWLVDHLAHTGLFPPRIRRVLLGGSAIFVYYHAWRLGRTLDGETDRAFCDRIRRLFDELRAHYRPEARIALFAHGYLIHHVARCLADAGLRRRLDVWVRPYIPHGGIAEMELHGGGRPELLQYNRVEHLRPATVDDL